MASNGFILWEGASQIDGAPIVAIVTGVSKASANAKTGPMLQTWIIRSDMAPVAAIMAGRDGAICGSCPHRGRMVADAMGLLRPQGRTCYVEVGRAPTAVYRAFRAGRYPKAPDLRALGSGRKVRLGAYGDPAAVPAEVWQALTSEAEMHTGYTHQWRTAAALRGLCMASADSAAEAAEAQANGWRTFRVRTAAEVPVAREAVCPASDEGGRKVDCATCGACNGAASGRRGSIVIVVHGAGSKAFRAAA